jgi:DNA-binding transcriptional ArsR family regulator
MEADIWYVLAGTRGGTNRVRVIELLVEEPRNANRIAEVLDLDYKTVRHHLDVLCEHEVVERADDDYGAQYRLTDEALEHRSTIDAVIETVG